MVLNLVVEVLHSNLYHWFWIPQHFYPFYHLLQFQSNLCPLSLYSLHRLVGRLDFLDLSKRLHIKGYVWLTIKELNAHCLYLLRISYRLFHTFFRYFWQTVLRLNDFSVLEEDFLIFWWHLISCQLHDLYKTVITMRYDGRMSSLTPFEKSNVLLSQTSVLIL